jgi:ubiquinone/menaquinone biosynthesis C-methylase UbiE
MSQFVGPDGAAMRDFILSQLNWDTIDRILDVGCGVGYDLYEIGARMKTRIADSSEIKPRSHFYGVDVSQEKINIAITDSRRDDQYEFRVHNFAEKLPFSDNYFDVVYSHNVLECAADKNSFLTELHRILKPGGRILCAHFDWDSAFYNGNDKGLICKITRTYADWQQDWMDACDGWMGRRLWGTMERSNLFVDAKLLSYQIMNTEYEFPYYGFKSVQGYGEMVAKGLVSENEYKAFVADMEEMARSGNYLFCITTFIYLASKAYV